MSTPFHPADMLSSSPHVTIHILLVYPFLKCCGNSLSGTPDGAESQSRPDQFKRLLSQELSVGFPIAPNSQRIKWSLLPLTHLWCTETCRIHRSVQSWVWRCCLTYQVFLISDSFISPTAHFPGSHCMGYLDLQHRHLLCLIQLFLPSLPLSFPLSFANKTETGSDPVDHHLTSCKKTVMHGRKVRWI